MTTSLCMAASGHCRPQASRFPVLPVQHWKPPRPQSLTAKFVELRLVPFGLPEGPWSGNRKYRSIKRSTGNM